MLDFIHSLFSFIITTIINIVKNITILKLKKSHKKTLEYLLNTKHFDLVYFLTNEQHVLFLSIFLITSSIFLIILQFITDI